MSVCYAIKGLVDRCDTFGGHAQLIGGVLLRSFLRDLLRLARAFCVSAIRSEVDHYRRRNRTDLIGALDAKREVTFTLKTKDQRGSRTNAELPG